MNTPDQPESTSPFEAQLKGIETALQDQFGVKTGANLAQNITVLRNFASMDKFTLESLLSRVAIISLNDEDYKRLQAKIGELLTANERASQQ